MDVGHTNSKSGATSSLSEGAFAQPLSAIPATPLETTPSHTPMSLSRSPSPRPNGGWHTPGLTEPSDTTPSRSKPHLAGINGFGNNDAQWAAARNKSKQVRGFPTIQTKNEGFFKRTRRQVSQVLPSFNHTNGAGKNWRDQEKLGRGRWYPGGSNGRFGTIRTYLGNVLRKFKLIFMLLGVIALITTIMSQARESTRSWSCCA